MAGIMDYADITVDTRKRVESLFSDAERAEACRLLREECGNNLPFCEKSSPAELERLRFAALKLRNGNLDRLYEAIDLAQSDWRDLLVAAGFANDIEAHRQWIPGADRAG